MVDRIRFADGSEGVGNLDSSAYVLGASGNFTWVLDAWVEGLRLDGEGEVFWTSLEDPLTGERRRFNGDEAFFVEFELRHDIAGTPLAYEVEVARGGDADVLFFDQSIRRGFDTFGVSATLEHKAFLGMNLRVTLQNLLDETNERERFLFETDRLGPLLRREERFRQRGRRLSVVLSDTF